MTQYLMSVWSTDGDATPTDDEIQKMYADVVMTDGPFSEAKEQLGGFWVVEVADLDAALELAALELAARGSKACQGRVEVRPFQNE